MVFQYTSKNGSSPEASEIDIISADYTEAMLIRNLDIKKVSDFVVSKENTNGSGPLRKQVVRFENLSRGQISRLKHFIQGYSSCCI